MGLVASQGALVMDSTRPFPGTAAAVHWDVFRQDHLLYGEDLGRMKPDRQIIDISCDERMGIDTSRPTTIAERVFRHKPNRRRGNGHFG
jgi:hypothetical protein